MSKINEKVKEIFDSKISFKILCGIGILIIALLIFSAGVTVGFHKASFGRAWGENYGRNFGLIPDRPLLGGDNFPNSNGAIGKIIKIELPDIIVQNKGSLEKVISISNNTQIEEKREPITENDLKVGDFVIAIGNPNVQGQIEAKFIRIMPLGMPDPLPAQIPVN